MAEIEPAEKHIPLHLLDQMAAEGGLLESDQRQTIEKHLSGCRHCQERLESVQKEREKYLKDHPAEELYRKVVHQAQDTRPAWYVHKRNLAIASGILVVLLTVGLLWFISDRQTAPEILVKGEGEIGFTVLHLDQRRSYHKARQITLQPGDQIHLQPVYPEGYAYLTVFSAEAGGSVTRLFDRTGMDTSRFPGLEVDDSPGPDHLLVVFSKKELPTRDDLARLEKELDLRIYTIRVDKNMPD
jgi:hypothetical protein